VFLRRGSYRTTVCSSIGAAPLAGFQIRGVDEGRDAAGCFDRRSLSALFLCVAPFPFAGRTVTVPLGPPSHPTR
jgi:hypothetical protein